MIRFIILVILCYILYRLVKNLMLPPSQKRGKQFNQSTGVITDEMVIDPHCHVYIPKREAITANVAGKTVYFCSQHCKQKYLDAQHEPH